MVGDDLIIEVVSDMFINISGQDTYPFTKWLLAKMKLMSEIELYCPNSTQIVVSGFKIPDSILTFLGSSH